MDGVYRLIYVVWNTLFCLLRQEDQVRCFRAVAGRLSDGGVFVVEAYVPSYLTRVRDHQYVEVQQVALDRIRLHAVRHDPVAQRLDESHVVLSEHGARIYPIVTRYAWPAELDLMARLAGLRLRERWGGWRREPFSADSVAHVSVYERESARRVVR